jgi:hypothetical protein
MRGITLTLTLWRNKMAEFVLFSTIIMFTLATIWSKNGVANLLIKVALYCMTVWGLYNFFGPANLVAQLSK